MGSVDLSLSAIVPSALLKSTTTCTAAATNGDKLFCMKITTTPADEPVTAPVQMASAASTLTVGWSDCGDPSTHTKITGFTPAAITTGAKATLVGKGNLDEDVAGASFDLELAAGIIKLSCKGDASASKTCSLPLGSGSLTFNALSFPIKAGPTSVNVDLSLSAKIPKQLLTSTTTCKATATNGDKLFCMSIKTTPEETTPEETVAEESALVPVGVAS